MLPQQRERLQAVTRWWEGYERYPYPNGPTEHEQDVAAALQTIDVLEREIKLLRARLEQPCTP